MKIIHQCLQVKGIKLKRLQEMSIHHRPNCHAFVKLAAEVDKEEMLRFMPQSAETLVTIAAAGVDGREKTLFCGYILRIHMEETAEYCLAKMLLADTSYLLDLQKERKSFQDLTQTYGAILRAACQQNGMDTKAEIRMNVPDKAIGEFVLQLDETDWQFARRMASRFGVPVFTDCAAEKPGLSIGLPTQAKEEKIPAWVETSRRYQEARWQLWQENSLVAGRQPIAEDFVSLRVETDNYLPLGTAVSWKGKSYRIAAVSGRLLDGMLHMRYRLAREKSLLAARQKNPTCAGMVLTGQVKDVRQDKVKVHFLEVDAAYEEAANKWFPYATTYSSSDGSGWYVMPSEGDYVRVFFPTQEEKDAFCISTINAAPPANTRNKTLRAPGGKELLLTDNSVHLITKHQDTFIDMSGSGIHIVTANKIKVTADKYVILEGNKIEMLAKDKISLKAGDVQLDILPKDIKLLAENVIMGGD
ncbi:Phage late control gene D protein (GPD) [Selenomonas ruminantium]|uniref:Phage late control gene D protein (GPD) n=1 Tax=Selenomonas ruminantium TaxID=971 RepID=A0A1I3ESF6_SELRU|nr:contractile injection system protein, VgrG/Pvc8 family [Selenomonas ruminantium]SFI01914.1 Phage late control gene D protein (GPD) [Selenomonas ruminantium]